MENAGNEDVKTRKDLTIARLSEKYPDKDFSDEETLYGQISDDYDDYDKQIGEYKNREQGIIDMFERDPQSAQFVSDWKDGKNPWVELVRMYGKDGLEEIINDEEKLEDFAQANEEYLARVAKEKELEEEYKRNVAESLNTIDAMQSEKGLSDEDIDKAMEFVVGIVRDGIVGKFTPETIEMALKAINHDMDVEEASTEGEIRGKNAKVEEKLRKNKPEGDGTAALYGTSANNATPKMPDLGALDRFNGNTNIWERGGEKRTKY